MKVDVYHLEKHGGWWRLRRHPNRYGTLRDLSPSKLLEWATVRLQGSTIYVHRESGALERIVKVPYA